VTKLVQHLVRFGGSVPQLLLIKSSNFRNFALDYVFLHKNLLVICSRTERAKSGRASFGKLGHSSLPDCLLHNDFDAHPGMNAALEQVLSLGKVRKRSGAALNDSSLCDGNIGETARAFRNDCLPVIESIDEASSKLFDFSEGMGLAALIGYQYRSSLFDLELIRFKIPAGVGCSRCRLGKQVGQIRGEPQCCQCNVLAEIRSQYAVKTGWFALVQGDDLCHPCRCWFFCLFLSARAHCTHK